jgi:26S proteasome regulatory subunit N1
VLIGNSERAEFATDEFISLNNIMENFVIVKKNPDFEPEKEEAPVKK